MARRPIQGTPDSGIQEATKDEPYAWEAREFMRKKLIGKEVCFSVEHKVATSTTREYYIMYLGKDQTGENIADSIVSEGLVEVKRPNKPNEYQQRLALLEDAAKEAKKGKWSTEPETEHQRDVKWTIENPRNFVDALHQTPTKAIVEHIRDGSTFRVVLLPDFHYITLMLSGIRCPIYKSAEDPELYADEARYFSESRLLNREVEVVLESVSNQNFIGSVIHPNGNIAELLLKEGFARCVDWSMASVTTGSEKLRAAEKAAKEKRSRVWKDYSPSGLNIEAKDKEFTGKIMEVVNADALVIKTSSDNAVKKVFLASIRPPRQNEDKQGETKEKGRNFRPLYDIPYMYEAREFLRKKLIGKKVNVVVDYIQPASNSFAERTCCTVTIGGINVAEALVSKGLATVVRYRQDDDQRSAHYDELLAAEMKAQKNGSGVHNKKEAPVHRVVEISGDQSKSKQFLPFLQRAGKMEAVVDFVASGSRLRLYIPRENCQITFLLGGISCPRASRQILGSSSQAGEPFGDEALLFTKELCLQREVEIEVETMDKVGNFIGWLWVEGVNLSVALVKEALASVHFTADRSPHQRDLQNAEDNAKRKREKIWLDFEETKNVEISVESSERKVNYKTVVITEFKQQDLNFYAQNVEDGPKLEELMINMRQEFTSNPPLTGAYTPKKNDICAAKFSGDDLWYRARVEKIMGDKVQVMFVDYGNRETSTVTRLASLPSTYSNFPNAAHEYAFAYVVTPKDIDLKLAAIDKLHEDVENCHLLLNVEYRTGGIAYVTLVTQEEKVDLAKALIQDGLLQVEKRKEKCYQKILSEYKEAETQARKKRLNLWQYGDITDDDAKEFGL